MTPRAKVPRYNVLAWVKADGPMRDVYPNASFLWIYNTAPPDARYVIVSDTWGRIRAIDIYGSKLKVSAGSLVEPKFLDVEFADEEHALAYLRIGYEHDSNGLLRMIRQTNLRITQTFV